MARKKSSQRKVKMGGDFKGNGNKESGGRQAMPEEAEFKGQNETNTEQMSKETQSDQSKQPPLSSDKHLMQRKAFNAPVRIKQEPKLNIDSHGCRQSNPHGHSQKEPTINLPKVKQEQGSKAIPSTAMDLGSHLDQSLIAPRVTSDLTWPPLMQPKNYPKPYEGESNLPLKKEKQSRPLIPVSSKSQIESSSSHGNIHSPSKDDHLATSSSLNDPPGSGISSVPNRFSSNNGKVHQTEGVSSAGGAGILDLSKKGLPPEIRRMLASKYGLPKRTDEQGGSMVPNFTKSRSRFTIGPKKPASSDTEPSAKMDTGLSPPLLDQGSETSGPETSSGSTQTQLPVATSAVTSASQVASESQSKTTEHLKGYGMLDLASHYGNLIKDSAPTVRPVAASRSPHLDELAASSGSQKQGGEPMIDLGSVSRLNELRVPALRRGGEPMIDLSAMETPTSPLSPSFRPVSFGVFPNPPYRPSSTITQTFRPRSTPVSRPPRHNASPGLIPRLPFGSHRAPSPDPRPAVGSMIDLGSFGKGNDFPSMVGRSDIVSLPSQVTRRIMPKRRHSLDSHSLREAAKRTCIERKKEESSVKVESNVKLNIGDLLKLEQEEQKYIKDLTFVQSKLTDVRFKIQTMQQELETLQSSESQIKRHIDMVRTKRVRILKDAQDREGSAGSSASCGSDVAEKTADRMSAVAEKDSVERMDRIVTYDRASPGYQSSFRDDHSDDFRGSNETKRKVDVVTDLEAEEKELMRGSERLLSRRVEIDRFGGYHYSNYVSRQHSGSHNEQEMSVYPAGEKPRGLEGNESPSDKVIFSEDMEKYSHDITESRDGTLLLTQNPLSHRIRKGSSSFLDQVKVSERDGPKQFLGCLEISSTTPEVVDDQILAENETKPKSSVSCDQEMISSTVSSVDDNVDELQDLNEMEFVGHTDAVCAIIPFRTKLFSASADRTVRVFDLKTGECTNTFQGHQKGINCLQIASDVGNRDRLFTGSNDQTVRAYNVKSGTCTHKFSFRGRVMCLHIAFGKLFVGLSSGFVAVIDLKSNKCINQFNCHEPSRISCLASAHTGQLSLLCTGSFDSTVTIRSQGSGRLVRTIKDHKLTVLCMQVVNNTLFSGSADTVVQSHNISTGELVQSYVGHSMSVSGLQAMGGEQGGVLVTSSLDRIIRCFDITSGDLLQLYGGNNDMVFSLAVCRDMIYTGCRDGKLSGIKLDLRKYHCCKWGTCSLKFGLLRHLKQHVQDHANQTYVFDTCLWENCTHKFHRGKHIDVMQSAVEHILSHVPDTET